jgi:5-formyltetrahydrofolate cyclo-ligase
MFYPRMSTTASKLALRKTARMMRGALQRENRDYAYTIACFDLGLPPNVVVAGYAPIASEADPGEVMRALAKHGHPLALPRIVEADSPLVFHAWQDGDALVPGAFGIGEPLKAAPAVTPDVLLVPLLAFDARGFRLGYGGGFYDRTLAALGAQKKIIAIGIAFAGQEVDAIPNEAFDARLDAVLTENGVKRFAEWCATHRPGQSGGAPD